MAEWQKMLHDKKLLVGAGLAGALGLGVLYARRKAGGTATTTDATAAPSGSGGGGYIGGFNSTGTDVASWLGNYSSALQGQMTDFLNQIQAGGGATPAPAAGGAIPNDQWGAAAFNWLATNNKWATISPTMAQVAIGDYLGGKTDVPPWEKWTINEILSGNRGSVHEGAGLAPPANMPPGWV